MKKKSPYEALERFVRKCGTQAACAARLEVSETFVSNLVRGEAIPGLATAFRLQDEAGINARAWLTVKPVRKKVQRRRTGKGRVN